MYTAGQIIDRKEHVKFANWKAVNDSNLISVSIGNGTYRLEEQVMYEKTIEVLAQEKRAERDSLINSITWRIERYNEQSFLGIKTTDDEFTFKRLLQYREYLRNIPEEKDFPNTTIKSFTHFKWE